MRRLKSRSIVRFCALGPIVGLAACISGAPPEREHTGAASSALTSADTCPGTRWIGAMDQSGTCPQPTGPGWNYQPLFLGAGATIPAGLDRYCLYELNHPGLPSATELLALPGQGVKTATQWLDADCMVVASLGDTAVAIAAVTPELEQSFLTAVEAPGALPPSNGPSVRVAIVDSWPNPGTVGNFDHGFGMAAIIRRLTCGPGAAPDCFLTPVPHLALNLVEPGVRDNLSGGYFGFQGRLAWSILNAVQAWQSSPVPGKLVVNLSVGWEAEYNLDELGGESQAVRAARAAIEYAACQGALVIAAAGNAGTGPSATSGPLYPAAWNQIAAPSCVGAVARPLLYAVSGLDGRDLPLDNARPGARASIAAPAYAAPGVMNLGGTPIITGPFTGSSVSAAVTSATAAAVWHQNGTLTPAAVMDLVRNSAVAGPTAADFCFSSASCPATRRVSLSRAVETASGTVLACSKHGWGAGLNPIWSFTDTMMISGLSTAAPLFDGLNLTTPITPAGCATPIFTLASTTRVPAYPVNYNPCPTETAVNEIVAPAVCPQPGGDPCPVCHITLMPFESILDLGISENVVDPVYPQTLSFSDGSTVVERYDLGRAKDVHDVYLADGLSGGKVYKVRMPAPTVSYGAGFKTASIDWLDASGSTKSTELIVQ